MEEYKIKHLEFVQSIINRMSSNSFAIKGWTITVLSALMALCVGNNNEHYILISCIPTMLFWLLDAYYLQQERKFRGIYNSIVKSTYDFLPFEMPINKFRKGEYCFFCVMWSKTIWPFYLLLLIGALVAFVLLHRVSCAI